jgi:hypothetical protein
MISATLLALAATGAGPAMASQSATQRAAVSRATAAPQATPVSTVLEGLQDFQTDRCLDSNAAGSVYTNPCQTPGNHYQMWHVTTWEVVNDMFGDLSIEYSLQDEQTGRCLDSNSAGSLYTNPCQAPGNRYQMWTASNGSGLNFGTNFIGDVQTGLYLDGNSAGSAYTHSYNGGNYQIWFAVP